MQKKIEAYINTIPRFVQFLWILVLVAMLFTGIVFFYIGTFLLPDTGELENPRYEIASQILASDGEELGKAFKLNREWLTYEQLNPKLVQALIATEDIRFYSHSGIDFRGTVRALFFLGKKGGASTITQQLAKQFFTQRSSSFLRRSWQKLKEWVIAVEFERRYTKEEILAMYLNKYDFLYGAIGVSTAAKTYFGKNQKDLSYDEAAILIGMLKNPYIYNPKINLDQGLQRRTVVLRQMEKKGYLSEEEYRKYASKKIDMSSFNREVYYTGIAPYFRAEVIQWAKNLLEDEEYRKPDGTKYNIFTDGLKIFTTIDYKMQQHAESAMREHMVSLQSKFFNVWRGKDPWTADADDAQKAARKNHLYEQFRQSQRFRDMRSRYMGEVSAKVMEEIPDARLNDIDIFRLFDADKDLTTLGKLMDRNVITRDQVRVYKRILSSELWPDLKSRWTRLRKEADAVFRKPVPMKVYDYTTGGEKLVTMSPMDSIKHHQMHMQIGAIGVDPKSGGVKVWVGGINHKYFQYDHVTSNRQVGSTFKPFIYGTAIIDQAISPCFKVQDVSYCIPANDPDFGLTSTWCPSNADGKFTGQYLTLKEGLKESKNSVSVFLMKQLGSVSAVRNFVGNLKIDKNKIPEAPSICLGTPELSAFDMASAYTAFANNGVQTTPIFVTHITDKDGRTIYSAIPEQKKAINPGYNYVIVDMLRYVASVIAPRFKSEIAGKTGTTNNYKDGWYVGFTPQLVVSTWVGGDSEWIRFTSLADGQGAVMARPFFEKLLTRIERDSGIDYDESARFMVPDELTVELDCSKYDALNASPAQKSTPVDESEEEN
ncbi:MAG: transglycosylase domain-containing protein [Saprospiraceae bacterium]|nr:transglycosylase domain-containing protein [Saprospiraceae bacterium]